MRRSIRCCQRALLGVMLVACALSVGCPARTQGTDPAEVEVRLQNTQRDIDLLEEINRLELSKEQLTGLIGQVEAIRARVEASEPERVAIMQRLEPLLEAKKAALLKDEGAPDVVDQQIEQQVEALQELDTRLEESLLEFVPRLRGDEGVLTEEQVDILTWVSEARMQAMAYVDWAREMSDEDFKTDAEVNAETLAEGRDITKDEILTVFRQAKAMSDEEYERERENLANRLLPAARDETAPIDVILIRRLQAPGLLGVLREKLAQMQ